MKSEEAGRRADIAEEIAAELAEVLALAEAEPSGFSSLSKKIAALVDEADALTAKYRAKEGYT